jgi:DNA mismatch repair protein MutS
LTALKAFEIDKQTLDDLAILPNGNDDNSVLSLFNQCITFGGRDKLKDIFSNPLTSDEQIDERLEIIKYLQDTDVEFGIDKGACDYIEFYLTQYNKPTSISKIGAWEKKIGFFFTGNNAYYIITRGIAYTLALLKILDEFVKTSDFNSLPKFLQEFHTAIDDTLKHPDFIFVKPLFIKKKPNAIDIAKADHLFRYKGFKGLKTLLGIVYQLDVFIAAGNVSKKLGLSYPTINKTGNQILKIEGLFHPFINKPVLNDIEFSFNKNVCFVTGANMAGKSTFLKATGVSVFLSQIGFPVPAVYMETSVFDGLITTINLADDIQYGNSHFYTEVSRVKHVANKMAESQNMLVIFDELFRGTNVKDAFDASRAIISAFSKLRNSFFIISTHIVEVAQELAAIENINFKFMETTFDNDAPKYSYKLQDGITEERLGMWIVKNEGIIEIIEAIINKENP